MIFVDTNYFLRFLLKDINNQYLEVKKLFLKASEGKEKLFTSTIVIFEINWVLSSVYKKSKGERAQTLQKVIALKFIDLAERQILSDSMVVFQNTSLDLEDCYNLAYAKARVAKEFRTFDIKLAKEFNKKL